MPRVTGTRCAEAEFLLELAGDLYYQGFIDAVGEFEAEAGFGDLNRFSETEDDCLRICGYRVETRCDPDEDDDGQDAEPDE